MISLFVVAAAAAAMPVSTQSDEDAPSVSVSFADLDLTSDRGQRLLRARLDRRIRQMCDVGSPIDLYVAGLRATCVKTANEQSQAAFTRAVANARRSSEVAAR